MFLVHGIPDRCVGEDGRMGEYAGGRVPSPTKPASQPGQPSIGISGNPERECLLSKKERAGSRHARSLKRVRTGSMTTALLGAEAGVGADFELGKLALRIRLTLPEGAEDGRQEAEGNADDARVGEREESVHLDEAAF